MWAANPSFVPVEVVVPSPCLRGTIMYRYQSWCEKCVPDILSGRAEAARVLHAICYDGRVVNKQQTCAINQ